MDRALREVGGHTRVLAGAPVPSAPKDTLFPSQASPLDPELGGLHVLGGTSVDRLGCEVT